MPNFEENNAKLILGNSEHKKHLLFGGTGKMPNFEENNNKLILGNRKQNIAAFVLRETGEQRPNLEGNKNNSGEQRT